MNTNQEPPRFAPFTPMEKLLLVAIVLVAAGLLKLLSLLRDLYLQ